MYYHNVEFDTTATLLFAYPAVPTREWLVLVLGVARGTCMCKRRVTLEMLLLGTPV